MNTLPDLRETLGAEAHRLRGIDSWRALDALGVEDLERVHALAQKVAYRAVSEGEDRETLRALGRGVRHLAELLERAPGSKPGLPRLRNELFSPGDLIDLYLGDTPGRRGSPWVTARVERVEKAFNADWAHDSSARGYYWRSTVRAVDGRDLLPGRPALGLSTTEPRALPRGDVERLREARSSDPTFFAAFCANAWRAWQPIWCMEAGVTCDAGAMDVGAWLGRA